MPYIPKVKAQNINTSGSRSTKGELNYLISALIVEHIISNGVNYNTISEAIGAAQDAADEAKRRLLAPYEDFKRSNPDNVDPFGGLESEIRRLK